MSSGCGDVLSLEDLKIAKQHQVFEAEVITGIAGGVAGGASIDYATNVATGQVQKTLPAVLRDAGYVPASFDFSTGGTLSSGDRDKVVLWPLSSGGDGDYYYWQGVLPKVIPAASTPATTGGVSSGAWRPVGDITLRKNLSTDGFGLIVDDSNIKTQQPSGGAVRSQHDKNYDVVSVKDFGAKGNGVRDDTIEINAAVSWLRANGGGKLAIPAGVYIFSSTLDFSSSETAPVTVEGAGKRASVFKYKGTATNIDLVYAVNSNYLSVSGIGIKSDTSMTAGAAIHLKWAGFNTLRDIAVGTQSEAPGNLKLYNGIYFESTDFTVLDDYLIFAKNRGLIVAGAGMSQSTYPQYDLWVNNGKISYCAVGINLAGGFDNFYIDNSMVTYNGINVVVDNAMYAQPNQISGFGPNCVIEYSQTGPNVYVNDTLAVYPHSQITFCGHISHGFSDGIAIASWPNCVITVKSPFIALNTEKNINVADNTVKLDIAPECAILGGKYGIFAQGPTLYCMLPNRVQDNSISRYNANVVPTNQVEGLSSPNYSIIVPAGSSTADAAVISKEYVLVNSNSSASTGVKLPNGWAGKKVTIYNVSTTAFKIYPSSGSQINASGADVAFSLPAGSSVQLYCASSAQWLK